MTHARLSDPPQLEQNAEDREGQTAPYEQHDLLTIVTNDREIIGDLRIALEK